MISTQLAPEEHGLVGINEDANLVIINIFYRAVCIQIAAFLIIRCFCKPHYGADTFGKLDRKEKGVERKAGRLSECAFD